MLMTKKANKGPVIYITHFDLNFVVIDLLFAIFFFFVYDLSVIGVY